MKRINFLLPMGILILLFFAASCTKDEKPSVGFSLKAVDVSAPVQSPNQSFQGSDYENPTLEWNIAWIYITQLEFDAEFYGISDLTGENKYPDFHYSWQGNQKIDLLDKPRFFASMELPEGQFKRFELKMTSARFSYTSGPNFFLSGIYGPAFGGTPIEVAVTHQFEMELKYDDGEAINTTDGEIFQSMVELSLSHVFSGITTEDLDNAELTDGWILISADHNQDLYDKILKNLHISPEDSLVWEVHEIQ